MLAAVVLPGRCRGVGQGCRPRSTLPSNSIWIWSFPVARLPPSRTLVFGVVLVLSPLLLSCAVVVFFAIRRGCGHRRGVVWGAAPPWGAPRASVLVGLLCFLFYSAARTIDHSLINQPKRDTEKSQRERERERGPRCTCVPSFRFLSLSPLQSPAIPSPLDQPTPAAGSSHHGLRRHHPHGHRRHRQWNCPGALPIPTADVLPHLEEEDGGAVLGGAVPRDAAQLHDVGALRPPAGAPQQHARHHHQRHRHGHRAHLHRALPRLLRRNRPPPGTPHPHRGGRLRPRGRRARPQPRPHPHQKVHGRRHPLRPLRHRHVRSAALRHENGDRDQERGVHAPVPVPGLSRQWHLLDCLRPHQVRPLHHYPQRAWRHVRYRAGDPVRDLLQVHAADPRGPQAQGRPDTHDGGRRRRQERRHHRRRRQRPLLEEAILSMLTRSSRSACVRAFINILSLS